MSIKFNFDFIPTECEGSDTRLGHTHGERPWDRYDSYRKMYENCTHVSRNLEIVFDNQASRTPYTFDFLKNIREVTGYILIVGNWLDHLSLPNLRVIHGRTLYIDQMYRDNDEATGRNATYGTETRSSRGYSLYVALNSEPNSTTNGLKEIHLPSLHGNIKDLFLMCFFFLNVFLLDAKK